MGGWVGGWVEWWVSDWLNEGMVNELDLGTVTVTLYYYFRI